MKIEFTKSETKNVKTVWGLARLRRKGYQIHTIDDKPVMGFCEACSCPIFNNDPSVTNDDDGVILCDKCFDVVEALRSLTNNKPESRIENG